MTYDQILDFYYPGLVRTRYTMTRTILPSLDGTSDAGSEPVTDAKSAVVTLSNPLDCLNLRREASTSSAILATMAHGTQVTLLEMGSAWSRVQYGTLSGYVKNEYISVIDDAVDETPEGVVSLGTAVVSLADESQTLNLRAAPTVNSAVLSHLRHGQTLTVLERYARWTYVQMGSLTGYVSNDYILFSQTEAESTPAPQATPAPETEKRTAIVLPAGGLNLRTSASRTAGVIMTLPQGTMLRVTGGQVDGMLPVALGDLTGFVASEYVFIATDEELGLTAATPTPAPAPTPTRSSMKRGTARAISSPSSLRSSQRSILSSPPSSWITPSRSRR